MILSDTDDLQALREVTRDFLSDVVPHGPVDLSVRVDRKLWERACQELGMAAVDVPEERDGLGLGPAGIAVLLEEAGRSLAPLPLLGSVVRAQGLLLSAAALSGDESLLDDVLPDLVGGRRVAAVAETDGAQPTIASRHGHGWVLHGSKQVVLDGVSADLLLIVAGTDGGDSLFLVDATEVDIRAAESLDLNRDFARLTLAGSHGRLVGPVGAWPELAAAVAPAFTLAVAAEALGSAEASLDAAVSYARTRVQFGRPIGSFQALKHALAEVAVLVDDARSALEHAMWAATSAPDQLSLAASIAAATATSAHLRVTTENIQVHGGIGFTWEHTAHLHFRRARSNAALFGDVRHHQSDVLRALGV